MGSTTCPERWPIAFSASVRPRCRTNHFAIVTDDPISMPAITDPRASPKNVQKCHGSSIVDSPTSAPASPTPPSATTTRGPYLSTSHPVRLDASAPDALPMRNPVEIVVYDQPNSSWIGLTKMVSTGPKPGTSANVAMNAAPTMAQP